MGVARMPRELTSTIQFDTRASRPKHAIVMIYDVEGFSKFFNQPDVQDYVPRFINHISNVIAAVIYGGEDYWTSTPEPFTPIHAPVHEKFLGDGGLYIWLPPENAKVFSTYFITTLCNRLWNIQGFFNEIRRKCAEDIPVYELPQGIRFGLARGTVYELTNRKTREREYIGFCINLASRLQKYCADLDFIASARIEIPETVLKEYKYIKVVATKLRGFPKEIVIVDKNEYKELTPEIKEELFESI